MKQMRIVAFLVIIALSAALILGGCGKDAKAEQNLAVENSGAEPEKNVQEEKFTGLYATYVGQVDNNSIEMVVDPSFDFPESGKPYTFRLSDSVIKYFQAGSRDKKDFKENDIVRFDCQITKDGQWEVTELFNTTAKETVYGPETGEYIGQIDSNSVEIKIKDQPRAFRMSPNVRLQVENSEPKTGQQVEIKYIKPGVGQEEIINLVTK